MISNIKNIVKYTAQQKAIGVAKSTIEKEVVARIKKKVESQYAIKISMSIKKVDAGREYGGVQYLGSNFKFALMLEWLYCANKEKYLKHTTMEDLYTYFKRTDLTGFSLLNIKTLKSGTEYDFIVAKNNLCKVSLISVGGNDTGATFTETLQLSVGIYGAHAHKIQKHIENFIEKRILDYRNREIPSAESYLRVISAKETYGGISWNSASLQKRGLDTIFIEDEIKKDLLSTLDNYQYVFNEFEKRGINQSLGLLFYGVPGTGKTVAIRAIATYLNLPIINVNTTIFRNMTAEDFVSSIQNNARGEAPQIRSRNGRNNNEDTTRKKVAFSAIIVFEELDMLFGDIPDSTEEKRTAKAVLPGNMIPLSDIVSEHPSENSDIEYKRKANSLAMQRVMQLLDGNISLYPMKPLFIATTNRKKIMDSLDPALLRPGRFNKQVEFVNMDRYMAERFCKSFDIEDSNEIDQLLQNCETIELGNKIRYNPVTIQKEITEFIIKKVNNKFHEISREEV